MKEDVVIAPVDAVWSALKDRKCSSRISLKKQIVPISNAKRYKAKKKKKVDY